MALTKKLRFDVLKRDDFTCQYCGRKAPDVVLNVDHLIPRAEGGGDEPENLIAACQDCNFGKGARALQNKTEIADLTERENMLRERMKAIRSYNQAREEAAAEEQRIIDDLVCHWFEMQGIEKMPRSFCVSDKTLRDYLNDGFSTVEIKDAMDAAERRRDLDHARYAHPRYFYGVMKWRRAERENRVQTCEFCGGKLMLEPHQDASLEWVHTACIPSTEQEAC